MSKIQAKSVKNKSLLIVHETRDSTRLKNLVFVLKNPKLQFPSFKMTKNPLQIVNVPRNLEERFISEYYSISTQNHELLLSKLQMYTLKKYYRMIVPRIFEIEYNQQLHTITVKASLFNTTIGSVMPFLMDLDRELEDYIELKPELKTEEVEIIQKTEIHIPNMIKIYNSISLVNINALTIRCLVCWNKIDYSTETLLFECCSGYTHLNHGYEWLQERKNCPKCGHNSPYTIQLPILSVA